MKRKKQVEFSKQVIADSFFKLLEKYSYAQITVSMICTEAGLARNTFYRNFDSTEAVLIYKLESVLEKAIQHLNTIENPTLRDLISWRVGVVQSFPNAIHIGSEQILEKIYQSFIRLNSEKVLKLVRPTEGKLDHLKIAYHKAGLQAALNTWLASGQQLSSDKLVELILEQMQANLNSNP